MDQAPQTGDINRRLREIERAKRGKASEILGGANQNSFAGANGKHELQQSSPERKKIASSTGTAIRIVRG